MNTLCGEKPTCGLRRQWLGGGDDGVGGRSISSENVDDASDGA